MEPIPLSLMQAGREVSEPRLAPDGGSVAFVQRWRGSTSIAVVDLDERVERQLSFGAEPAAGRGLSGGCFAWVPRAGSPDALVFCARDGELWLQEATSARPITSHGRTVRAPCVAERARTPPIPTARAATGTATGTATESATPTGTSSRPGAPAATWTGTVVAYALDESEIHLLDLGTGRGVRLDDGRHGFCFDPALSADGRRVSWQGWSAPSMPWDDSERVDVDLDTGAISTWRPADGAVQQPRFTSAGDAVHVHDGSGWLNVHVGHRRVVAEAVEHAGPTWGMGNRSFASDDSGRWIAVARNESGFGSLDVADLATGAVRHVARGVHGQLSWVGDRLAALRTGARTPTQVVVYDTAGWARTTVAASAAAPWATSELPEPELVDALARDGLALHARRFTAGRGRMLVMVHGGPTDQWQVDWRPRIAYWWSRGWDVLVVDPRGTTGHGRTHQQALHGRWGRADVDDTADLVALAHREGWATPASTVVVGGSSGGLTAVGLMCDRSDLVAGGVVSYPVSDLRALTESTHRFEAHYTDTLVGPDDGSEATAARFRELSPLHRAESISAPLLVFHGTDDPVVPVEQSRALVERITSAGGEVELVEYEGEGHGFRQPDAVADEHRRTEAFLDRVAPAG
ncbi:prolyl oligopeptidase family serine peptidase [Ilumatobacter sp.]|uniref:S9 family peptidase n=1 Tax=Ilumatobacter sp. TaxID=1967498 RepID=UPI003B52EA2A